MKVVLCGTSSAGKTSVMRSFSRSYKKVSFDDIIDDESTDAKINSKLENKFYSAKEKTKHREKMLNDILMKKTSGAHFVIDIVGGMVATQMRSFLPKSTKYVLVYTGIDQLARNLKTRKSKDPRFIKHVMQDYAKIYERAIQGETGIDTISYAKVVRCLNEFKSEFTSKADLEAFAVSTLKKMNIHDKKLHDIVPHNRNEYDLIMITKGMAIEKVRDSILKNFAKQ